MGISFGFTRSSCGRTQALLDRYVEKDLSPAAMDDVDQHIRDCQSCRKELDALYTVVQLVEGLDSMVPPHGLWNRVSEQLALDAPSYHRSPEFQPSLGIVWWLQSGSRWRISGAVAATVAVTALVTLGVLRPQSPGVGQPYAAGPEASFVAARGPLPFVSQYEEAKFFDPLADRASVGAVIEVADRSAHMVPVQSYGVRVDNVASGSMGQ
jgi:hypothetical protein